MLNIFTSSDEAEKAGYKVEKDIDALYRRKSTNMKYQYADETSSLILKEIEGMTERNKDRIEGKFGDVSLFDISTGGKGCILAVNYTDFIIVADQLGRNCLKLLASLDRDTNVVYSEPLYIFDNQYVKIDNVKLFGYEASKAMEDSYYSNYEPEE